MAEPNPYWLETSEGATGALRIEFFDAGDRFSHSLGVVQQGQLRRYLRSVEGPGRGQDDVWPLSPPVQEIHVQGETPNERTLFLTGATQGGHWSAVVSCCGSADRPGLLFDVAARVHRQPGWLGFGYESAAGAAWASGAEVHCEQSSARLAFRQASDPSSDVPLSPLAGAATTSGIRCYEAPSTPEQLPATLRWQYTIVLLG